MIVTEPYKSPEDILAACRTVRNWTPVSFPDDLAPDPMTQGAPAWQEFERTTWDIGERIRQTFLVKPNFKKNPDLIQAIVEIIQDRNLRRGRESFVMLLGFAGAAKHAPLVASLANDPDIQGHVVDTLLRMRAPGFAGQVSGLTTHPRPWIRRLAKRYIERYPAAA